MKSLIFIFIGGGLGSVLRYGVNIFFASGKLAALPLATLTANSISSFILGFVLSIATDKIPITDPVKLMLTVGFCGGFSTFSTFTLENYQLLKDGNLLGLTLNIGLSLIICLIFIILGMHSAKLIGIR